MGIETALYSGVSGLDAMSQELSVIGNNIANSNTIGFKGGSTTFANLLSTSLGGTSAVQTGNGVQVTTVGTDFSQGTLQTTTNPLDLAIQGAGFFTVKATTGSVFYTRAGQFSVDKNGNIVLPSGDFLQGAAALTQPTTSSSGVTTPGTFGATGDINISQIGVGAPTPTANATIYANLLQSTQATKGTITITTANDKIEVMASAQFAATLKSAVTVTIPTGTYAAASIFAAQVASSINAGLFSIGSAAIGSTAVSLTYGSAGNVSQYEFTINNVSAANQLTFEWNNAATTAGNMLGFTGTTTIAAATGTATGQFQVTGFDPNNPNGVFSTAMTVYDSSGNSHLVNVYFENITNIEGSSSTAPGGGNRWMWSAVVPASDSVSGNPQVAATGILDFNTQGALYAVDPDLNTNPAVTVPTSYNSIFDFNGGVSQNQTVSFDFGQKENETIAQLGSGTTGTTQYGSPSSVTNQYQDGFPAGSLQSFSVSQNGTLTGTFTNGQTKDIAQIELARFNAPTQLTNAGNNLYTQSAGSGQPIPGLAGDAGFGSIFSDSLEESNVDLSSEFVNMITVQSAYQADAKVISTAQELFTALQNAKQ